MNVLVLNCGSSTVKFQIIETDQELIESDGDRRLARGTIERIGSQALITFQAEGRQKARSAEPVRNHREAVDRILRWIISPDSKVESVQSLSDIHAVGHRVVHGGELFRKSVLVEPAVIEGIEDNIELAPLHNPANLRGIHAARELMGEGVPQVAVFDTSFHSTMPDVAYLYGIPYQHYRRHKIRRYGFHGTSHRYVAYRYRRIKGLERDQVRIITLHLGNGCSACAIADGESVDTSMGFTPLEGLLMGTRSGNVDPSLVDFLMMKEGLSSSEVDTLLNKQSGLLGISGLTGDMRELLEEEAENQDRRARLAIDIFCRRVRHYVGAYYALLGTGEGGKSAEAVVFTGGIGENSPAIRARVCRGLECLGLQLDAQRNEAVGPGDEGEITRDGSPVAAWAIPTNEELLIARDTFRVITGAPRRW